MEDKLIKVNQIISRLEEIESEISVNIDLYDAVKIEDHARKVSSLIAESGSLLALSKKLKREAIGSEIISKIRDLSNQILPASIAKMQIDSAVNIYYYIEDYSERMNTACTHRVNLCITLISKYKEEMRLHNKANGQ
jgi:hypothetical protein